MTFSYNWLQSFFDKKLPKPDKLAEVLTLKFSEVEGIKKIGKDFALDIDMKTNRADTFSHLGIAREVGAILGYNFNPEKLLTTHKLKAVKKTEAGSFRINIKAKKGCKRYMALAIEGVKIGESPKWLKEALAACGLNSINNVVDVTNYVMLETGQPLHAFDLDKIGGQNIVVRFAKNGEKIPALDGKTYNLNENILVIADKDNPLAIAGIKGGEKAQIDKNTKTIVLESANFEREVVRKASRQLNLRTDASVRFDHGVDPNLARFAMLRAVFLIQKVAGGKAARHLFDFYPVENNSKLNVIKFEFSKLESLLGVVVPKKEVLRILKSLGMRIDKNTSDYLMVAIPSFRQDILIAEDLIEEVGRIYGYEKIPMELPEALIAPPKRNFEVFWANFFKNVLKEMGFVEMYNYSFISREDEKIFDFKNLAELENPLSSDYLYLRPNLLAGMLKNVVKNQENFEEIKLFEIGDVFENKGSKSTILETKRLAGLITGDSFYSLKGAIDLILNKAGITNIWYDDYEVKTDYNIWVAGRVAEIKVGANKVPLGLLGEVATETLAAYKIKKRMVVFELDFDKLVELASEEQEYRPLSKYPAVVRDLAILAPSWVKVESILNKIEMEGGELLRDVELFDMYEGEGIREDKKNLAFHLIFQSQDKALTSLEVEEICQRIIKVLEENPDWEVRK